MSSLSDKAWLMREAARITKALGETFAPSCEVVLHDLTDPEHAIIQIENNLSGRAVGDSATELGLARISDPTLPDVIANYANQFADGRPVKSTSVGLKDKTGKYIAAICMNIDISYLKSISAYLNELTKVQSDAPVSEHLVKPVGDLEARILAFSAARNREPRALTSDEKREILQQLANEGELERRGAAEKIASIIGVSRSNVYYYLKKAKGSDSGARPDVKPKRVAHGQDKPRSAPPKPRRSADRRGKARSSK
jgi:predicted transcriptional regulator YheO